MIYLSEFSPPIKPLTCSSSGRKEFFNTHIICEHKQSMHRDDSRAFKANPSPEVVNHREFRCLRVGEHKRRRWTSADKAKLNLIKRRYLTQSRADLIRVSLWFAIVPECTPCNLNNLLFDSICINYNWSGLRVIAASLSSDWVMRLKETNANKFNNKQIFCLPLSVPTSID